MATFFFARKKKTWEHTNIHMEVEGALGCMNNANLEKNSKLYN